jgi:peptide-methionine (S)-S-oxide reductase
MKRLIALALLALASWSTAAEQKLEKAIFAAGCFWCTEAAFQEVPGVVSAVSGYTGGTVKHPTYEQVSSGRTGHAESVLVTFDPSKVSYDQLLDIFWVNHDPTVTNQQFCDHGTQYRPAIFYLNDAQKRLAEASKAKWEKMKPFKQPILTQIVPAGEFWPAEDYHQDYYKTHSLQYNFYVTGCGRYQRLQSLWGPLRDKYNVHH